MGINIKNFNTILIPLLIIFLFYSIIDINKPWKYDHDGFNGGLYSIMAMNIIKHGFFSNKMGVVLDNTYSLNTKNSPKIYYTHYPPLMTFLISVSFRIFGIHEWSARTVILMFNIITIISLFLLTKKLFNNYTALFTTFFLIFTPMMFNLRTFVSVETPVLSFILLSLLLYVNWYKNQKSNLIWFFLSFILGFLMDWWIFFLIPVIIFHYYFIIKGKDKRLILLIPLSVIYILLYFIYIFSLTGSFSGGSNYEDRFIKQLLFRLNLSEDSKKYNITFIELTKKLLFYFELEYTSIFIFVPIIYATILFFNIKSKKFKTLSLPILLFLSYLSFLYIFSNLSFIHIYFLMFLLPPLVIFLGVITFEIIVLINSKIEYPPFKKILISLFVIFITTSYLFIMMPKIIEIRKSSYIIPIVDFFAKIRNGVLISFDEPKNFYQLRYYTNQINLEKIENLKELINKTNEKKYDYFVIKNEKIPDIRLRDFLKHFNNVTIENYAGVNYTVFVIENYATVNYTIFVIK